MGVSFMTHVQTQMDRYLFPLGRNVTSAAVHFCEFHMYNI